MKIGRMSSSYSSLKLALSVNLPTKNVSPAQLIYEIQQVLSEVAVF